LVWTSDSFIIWTKQVSSLYKGFIRPHLEYAIQSWSAYLKKDIENIRRKYKDELQN